MHTSDHEPKQLDSEVAGAEPGGTASDSAGADSPESGAQHGVRGRAGDRGLGGSSTEPPEYTTRYIETSKGILSYQDLAPLLADCVAMVEDRIALGEYAAAALDEDLILTLHRDIAEELVPSIGGEWRRKDVRISEHEPPTYARVPELLREYTRNLVARLDNAREDYNLLLEALAFAEGQLLSIHPFEDFNGRVTRVFLSELLRRLDLPPIDPTPNAGPPTQRYLAALAAADRRDWRPLAMIWRERIDADEFFESAFTVLTGYDKPMRWQTRLFRDHFIADDLPGSVSIPTGLGKTAVMAVWLIALAWQMRNAVAHKLPRRLVYVVDRRAVVDQATDFAEKLRDRLATSDATELRAALGLGDRKLPISTLRGQFVGNREWLEDPANPAIIVGTVDMIGSRLLFEGYGVSRKMRPYHAGLMGADALVLLDEAHLVPPFEALLETIANGTREFGPREDGNDQHVPPFRLLPLSATGRTRTATPFQLEGVDFRNPDDEMVLKRLGAKKNLQVRTLADSKTKLSEELAKTAWALTESGTRPVRCLVYCNSRQTAQETGAALQALINSVRKHKRGRRASGAVNTGEAKIAIELFVGARRVHERGLAAERLATLGFLAESKSEGLRPAFLIATSAGEVGVDLDADHMVCDLVAWERMVQRLGRVNRRGEGDATVIVVDSSELKLDKEETADKEELKRRHQFARQAIERLPESAPGIRQASPAALRDLARDAGEDDELRALVHAGSTPAPIRPALTRPLVDAWSMTSLEKHTGRPRIEPWLRGWVSDPPQTTVLWRSHLPIRLSKLEPNKQKLKELEDFFEAAAPHASELLETETFRVLEWLMKRAARFSGSALTAAPQPAESDEDQAEPNVDDASEAASDVESSGAGIGDTTPEKPTSPVDDAFRPEDVVGFVLSARGDLECTLRLRDIPTEPAKSSSEAVKKQATDKKKRLQDSLAGAVLILSDHLGGLSEGLLKPESDDLATTADGSAQWNGITFRVREATSEAAADPRNNWLESLRFDLERTPEGEATRWLVVEKWRDSSSNEDDRAAGPPQSLAEHQSWAEEKAWDIARRLGLADAHPQHARMFAIAARLHDEGKKAALWQDAFRAPRKDRPYAKTLGPMIRGMLSGYRHEFGSLPYAQQNEDFRKLPDELQELALHLIAAHHGFARPVIATSGCEDAPPSVLEARAREVALRFARLQRRWGPWGLAWWEALLRAADQQASRANTAQNQKRNKGNP